MTAFNPGQSQLDLLSAHDKVSRARIMELEREVAELQASVKGWMAHASKYENRADVAEKNLAALRTPQYPADMLGRPVTAPVSEFNYDMDAAPRGGKLIVLNLGNVATFAVLTDRNKHDFKAWAPLPKIRKDKR